MNTTPQHNSFDRFLDILCSKTATVVAIVILIILTFPFSLVVLLIWALLKYLSK